MSRCLLSTPAYALLLALALLALPWGGGGSESARAQAPAAQTVAANWPLIPEGIEVGDSFRLLFVTASTTGASSTDYNAHVRRAAGTTTA